MGVGGGWAGYCRRPGPVCAAVCCTSHVDSVDVTCCVDLEHRNTVASVLPPSQSPRSQSRLWNNEKEIPRWGGAEIQKIERRN